MESREQSDEDDSKKQVERSRKFSPLVGKPHKRDIFEGSYSGAQERPYIPRLRSDPNPYRPLPHSLEEYRYEEGIEARENRLRKLWRKATTVDTSSPSIDRTTSNEESRSLAVDRRTAPYVIISTPASTADKDILSRESARALSKDYVDEIKVWCRHSSHSGEGIQKNRDAVADEIPFEAFMKYADSKEEGEISSTYIS